jgi:hypothetical protein
MLEKLRRARKRFSVGAVSVVMNPATDVKRPQSRSNDLHRAFPQFFDRRQPCVGVVGRVANSDDFRHEDSVCSPSLMGKYIILVTPAPPEVRHLQFP